MFVDEKTRNSYPNLVKYHKFITEIPAFKKWVGPAVYCNSMFNIQ